MKPPINHLRDIIQISLPIVVGQLGMVLTGFFDNYMVAQLGHEELAAAGICNSVYFLAAVFPMGVTIAFSTIIGILLGKNRENSIYIFLKNALYTTAILSVITVLVLMGVIHNFSIFGQEPEVNVLSIPYMKLLTISFTPMLFFYMFKHVADGFSYTLAGMKVTLYALAINVFLNWVLIHGNLGMPAYGLNGAGYATIISRIYLACAMFYFLFKSKQIPVYFQKFKSNLSRYKHVSFYNQIWSLGAPSGLQYFFEIAAFVFAAIMAGWVNSESLAAHQMAITIAALTYMFASGISSGSSICVAKSYGNKNAENIKAYGKNAHLLGVSIMFLFSIILISFSTPLAKLFATEKEVYELGARLLILAGVFQLGDGIQAISLGLLRGIEDTLIPSIFIFIAYWFVSMPLAYYLCFKSPFEHEYLSGVEGVWIGLSTGLILTAILLSTRFYVLIRRNQP